MQSHITCASAHIQNFWTEGVYSLTSMAFSNILLLKSDIVLKTFLE